MLTVLGGLAEFERSLIGANASRHSAGTGTRGNVRQADKAEPEAHHCGALFGR
jgi:hypothetical protein